MRQRTIGLAAIAFAAMLAACSQAQSGATATPEAPAYATTTGALACDEYLALARACIEKGRFEDPIGRREEFGAVERMIRAAVSGAPIALERANLWRSAVSAAGVEQRRKGLVRGKAEKEHMVPVDTLPTAELCRRGIDELPASCQ